MINLKSDITVKVLGYYFINPEARHYVRELALLLKLDPGNLSRKMLELSRLGLFLVETEGKNHYFKLNQKFPLLKEYQTIYDAKFGVETSLREALVSIGGIKEVYIFGSYAKGNFEPGSDIDLLIISDAEHAKIIKAITVLEKRWQREINTIDMSYQEYLNKKNKDDFLKNIFSSKTIRIV